MKYTVLSVESATKLGGQDLGSPLTAVTVRFGDGSERLFYMQLPTEGRRVITNGAGRWKTIGGQFVDPTTQPSDTLYETEEINIDPVEIMHQNIEAYLDRCNNQPVHEEVSKRDGETRTEVESRLAALKNSVKIERTKRNKTERPNVARKKAR